MSVTGLTVTDMRKEIAAKLEGLSVPKGYWSFDGKGARIVVGDAVLTYALKAGSSWRGFTNLLDNVERDIGRARADLDKRRRAAAKDPKQLDIEDVVEDRQKSSSR